jgi:hypothetical protein
MLAGMENIIKNKLQLSNGRGRKNNTNAKIFGETICFKKKPKQKNSN